ncbi:MAG: hypothetical protein ABS75_26165 [Pelagibacterium sp. SCN 63-23]|nr:MAG: hypothetical protein ABS75_26165 [Pelagibacterium sp. SCN 63-23]
MTTISLSDWAQSPEIVLGESEHRLLTRLAMTEAGLTAERADYLLFELDRARLVPDAQVPPDVVRLGSVVRFRDQSTGERTVELVLPAQDNEMDGKLSVTSSRGSALLGMRAGQSITWIEPGQGPHRLRVLRVSPPISGDPGPSAA